MSLTAEYSLVDLGQPMLAGSGLTVLFLLLVAEVDTVTIGSNPVRTFHAWFCAICAFWVLWKLPGTAQHQSWFAGCGLQLAERRGLGHKGMPVLGIFSPPKISPSLFPALGVSLAVALGVAASGVYAPRIFTAVAFGIYMLYYTQVFADACAGGHGTVLMPSVLFILACAPHLDDDYIDNVGPWPLLLLKIQIASGALAARNFCERSNFQVVVLLQAIVHLGC
eukprot:SAG31_NODE_3084_length_4695_cov_3.336741_5_plen_223_part_00